jgi:uncharacterized protein YraI
MLGRNMLWAVGAVLAGLLLPAQAMAQYEAYTRADLNLRVGPGTHYGVIDVIPRGDPVDVFGCLAEFEWCDVEWYGLRGWVSARYLVQPGTTVYLPQVAPRIGVPIITFSFGAYHDRYYRDRPWYRERSGRWRGRDYRDRQRAPRRSEPRQERRQETQQPRERRQETQQPRERRQETQQPRERRQQESQQPRQQREAEQPQQLERTPQQADQPRRGERIQRQGQPTRGERSQRRRSGGEEEEEELQQRGQ